MKLDSYYLFVKAFGSPVRLQILKLLEKSPKAVKEICEELNLEQSKVSHNLKCLSDCGFIKSRREGRKKIYYLNKEVVIPLFKIIDRHILKYKNHLAKCGIIKGDNEYGRKNREE